MKYLFLIFTLTILLYDLNGQSTKIGFTTGIGSYQMTDMKSLMQDAIKYNELQPKIVTNFPAYLYFQPSISFCHPTTNWGFNFTWLSTGSRASIRDYSADYRFDTKVIGYAPAIFIEEKIILEKEGFQIDIGTDIGMLYSTIDFSEYFRLGDTEFTNETIKAMSINFFMQPKVNTSLLINKKISFKASIGYHIDIWNGGMSEPMDISDYFDYVGQNGYKLQWNGVRLGVGCCYMFD